MPTKTPLRSPSRPSPLGVPWVKIAEHPPGKELDSEGRSPPHGGEGSLGSVALYPGIVTEGCVMSKNPAEAGLESSPVSAKRGSETRY
jgi:hypothetical protein